MTRIEPRGLSRAEAAAYVGIRTSLFHDLVAAGTLPQPIKLGGRRVWDRAALDEAIDRLGGRPSARPAGQTASTIWDDPRT